LGVVLDVVYNHAGPAGNYLKSFSGDYFTDRYTTDWGKPFNFDGPQSHPVREFFAANAGYWIDEFHLDGLRLDATQNVYDESEKHILAEITERVRMKGASRSTIVIAENEVQNTALIRPVEKGGYGMDALWNDDFHHSAIVALTGHTRPIILTIAVPRRNSWPGRNGAFFIKDSIIAGNASGAAPQLLG
jgi:maltooligosyltrehalose trehalohydrolase